MQPENINNFICSGSHNNCNGLIFHFKKANELPLTVHLMDGLMRNTHLTLEDKKYILQLMEQQDIHPTTYFLETLHKVLSVTRERIIVQKVWFY